MQLAVFSWPKAFKKLKDHSRHKFHTEHPVADCKVKPNSNGMLLFLPQLVLKNTSIVFMPKTNVILGRTRLSCSPKGQLKAPSSLSPTLTLQSLFSYFYFIKSSLLIYTIASVFCLFAWGSCVPKCVCVYLHFVWMHACSLALFFCLLILFYPNF